MNKIYFTSDLHFYHKNILHFSKRRQQLLDISAKQLDDNAWVYRDLVSGNELSEEDAIKLMNERIVDMWNTLIDKKDTVYIIGDFSFGSTEDTQKIFHKLHGKKFIIWGNHDSSAKGIDGWMSKTDIDFVNFKAKNFDFLNENLLVSMCHYPMVSWERKNHGSVQLHGHCHGNCDAFNDASPDLRLDVGFDGKKPFWSLEEVYEYFLGKTNGVKFTEYCKNKEMVI